MLIRGRHRVLRCQHLFEEIAAALWLISLVEQSPISVLIFWKLTVRHTRSSPSPPYDEASVHTSSERGG